MTTKNRTVILADEDESESDTEASSGEWPRDAFELRDEIYGKLVQVDGILAVTRSARDFLDKESPVCGALWAASELIDDAQKAVDELYEQVSAKRRCSHEQGQGS